MRSQAESTILHTLPGSAPRLLFIDNIRWLMIMLVLSMHAAVTYSNQGGWYYTENRQLSRPVLIIFILYQSFLQSFFMPLLFFIAGYFVPSAFDKKGPARFLKDRAIRLGLPTLFYVLILGPLTEYYISHSWHPDPVDRSFIKEYTYYFTRFRFPGGTGPLWFCEALLIFCLIYTLCRKYFHYRLVNKFISRPTYPSLLLFILLDGLATFLIRIPFDKGTSFFNLQIPYFAGYILFFTVGILAYRRNWFLSIPENLGLRSGWISALSAIVIWPALMVAGGALKGQTGLYQGGLTWQSLGLSIWEALAGVSMSLFLFMYFRKHFNNQGKLSRFFSNDAFAVYVIHPPILIMLARALSSLHWHPMLKFLTLTFLSITVSFLFCALIIRRIPLLNKILYSEKLQKIQ